MLFLIGELEVEAIMVVNMAVDKEKMESFNMKTEEEWNHLKLEHINRKITSNQHWVEIPGINLAR